MDEFYRTLVYGKVHGRIPVDPPRLVMVCRLRIVQMVTEVDHPHRPPEMLPTIVDVDSNVFLREVKFPLDTFVRPVSTLGHQVDTELQRGKEQFLLKLSDVVVHLSSEFLTDPLFKPRHGVLQPTHDDRLPSKG